MSCEHSASTYSFISTCIRTKMLTNPPVCHVALTGFTRYKLPVGGTVSASGLSWRRPREARHFAPSPLESRTRTSFLPLGFCSPRALFVSLRCSRFPSTSSSPPYFFFSSPLSTPDSSLINGRCAREPLRPPPHLPLARALSHSLSLF